MRRSEITPELIELSKRAKELGFPQDVEEGDWFSAKGWKNPWLCDDHSKFIFDKNTVYYEENKISDRWFLILSFSRCLEWLESESKGEMIGLDLNNFIHGYWILGMKSRTYRGENIHEAIAKAVVKILEGER